MLKHLFVFLLLVASGYTRAQDTSHNGIGCGLFEAYIRAHGLAGPSAHPESTLLPAAFPPGAIETCGRIKVYYEDLAIAASGGIVDGFAKAGGVGATRRNTICNMLNYLQYVFDFSKIPSGQYLRLLISRSIVPAYPAGTVKGTLASWESKLGVAAPYYDSTHARGDTVNGYFYDFVHTGIDPTNTNNYHGELQFNFDAISDNTSRFLTGTGVELRPRLAPVVCYDGLGTVPSCSYDLYSNSLHFMCHIMGMLSWGYDGHVSVEKPFVSAFVSSLYAGPLVDTSYNPTVPADLVPLLDRPISPWYSYWSNNKPAPYNYPTSIYDQGHLGFNGGMYYMADRVSPGDLQLYVMRWEFFQGLANRRFLKGDLETIHNNLKYSYTPAFLSDSAIMLNNHVPWSSKMSFAYSIPMRQGTLDLMPADFTMTNNTGSSVTITLAADTSLHDDDGDVLSILPGSLINYAGCGVGGNNHDLLTISDSGRKITFSPRHNFYGRAKFGFTLFDGKEKGAHILYTIDVQKGNNVAITRGTNMIQNPDLEEGEEVRLPGVANDVNNAILLFSDTRTSSRQGGNSIDGRWFSNSSIIRNSYYECGSIPVAPYGEFRHSFPMNTPDGSMTFIDTPERARYPDVPAVNGNRYLYADGPGFYLLNDTMRNCKRYILEFDIARTFLKTSIGEAYPASETVSLGFTAAYLLQVPALTHLVQTYKPAGIGAPKVGEWTRVKIPFTYCSDTPATVMYLNIPTYNRDQAASLVMDNFSLIELPDTTKLTVAISDSASGPRCTRRLYTNVPDMACPMSFEWRKLDGTLIATTATVTVDNTLGGTYTLKMADGCGRIARDTHYVAPCPCMPGGVFGPTVTSYTTLAGTVTGPLPAGYYYVPADITITGVTSFTNAQMLIEPGVTITVANNARLTIDSSHLFVCPDTNLLWKGIVLSGGTNSGRISLKSNTLIEDAISGITISSPVHPGSGLLIETNQATFNRCITGITINNDTNTTAVYPYSILSSVFTSRQFKTYLNYPIKWPSANELRQLMHASSSPAFTGATAPVEIDRKYAGAICKNGLIPFAGIRLNRVGRTLGSGSSYTYYGMQIGEVGTTSGPDYRNIFDNTGDGIYAYRVNLTLANSIFMRMSKPSPVSTPVSTLPIPLGIGVRATGDAYPYKLKLLPSSGVNDMRNVRFYDCLTGLNAVNFRHTESKGSWAQTSNTSYTSTATGFDISTQYYDSVLLTTDNRVYNVPNGIVFTPNSSIAGYKMGYSSISNNFFGDQPATPAATGSSYFVRQAIKASSAISGMSGAVSSRMYIVGNTITNAYNGIAVSYMRSQGASTESNIITLKADPTAAVQYGISYMSCNNGDLKRNNVSTTTATSDKVRGFYMSANTAARLYCNTVTNTGRGFDFIGTQPGTEWMGNIMSGNLKGLALGGPIDAQRGTINSCWAQWMLPGGWSAGSGRYQTYAYYASISSPLYINNTMWADRTGIPTVNFGTLISNIYSLSSNSLKYPQIKGIDPCMIVDPVTPLPRPTTSTTATGTLSATMLFTRFAAEGQWLAQHGIWQAMAVDSIFNDTLRQDLVPFVVNATGSRYQWLTDIENALSAKDLVTAANLLNSPVPAMGIQTISPDLVITDDASGDPVVNHYVMFYNLYRDYLTNDTLADSTTLDYLARLCPLANGAVVYQARTLFSKVYGDAGTYDDDDLCGVPYTQGGYQYKMAPVAPLQNATMKQAYELFPNPNSGIFTLRQLNHDEQPVDVSVYDALGRQISNRQVSFKQGPVSIQSGAVLPGLYLVCIRDHAGNNCCFKFTVNKN